MKEGKVIWERLDKGSGSWNPFRFFISLFSFLSSNVIGVNLTGEELTIGNHIKLRLQNQSKLKLGKVYSLTIQGIDFAGNVGNSETIQGITIVNLHE